MKGAKTGKDQIYAYALKGALQEIEKLLTLFPELRARLAHGGALDDAITEHWQATKSGKAKPKTPAHIASTNGSLAGLSLRDALRRVLTVKAKTTGQLREELLANGFQHRGTSPIGSRISQEAAELRKTGEAAKTANGWKRTAKGKAVARTMLPPEPQEGGETAP